MKDYLGRRSVGPGASYPSDHRKIYHMVETSFCDKARCMSLASWRIGKGVRSVALCSRHTVDVMRDGKVWRGLF